MEKWINLSKKVNVGLGVLALILLTMAPLVFVESAMAQGVDQTNASTPAPQNDSGTGAITGPLTDAQARVHAWAFVAAALATGIGSMGAGFAVAHVGAAAMGAVAEQPELMGKSLIYVALAEGIAIYGLLISIIVLSKV